MRLAAQNAAAQAGTSPRDCLAARSGITLAPRIKLNHPAPSRTVSEVSSTSLDLSPSLQFGGSDAALHRGSTMKAKRRASLSIASLLLAGVAFAAPALGDDKGDDRCAGARDVKLVNGRIHTLDASNSIVS